jgi:hypothetical protein
LQKIQIKETTSTKIQLIHLLTKSLKNLEIRTRSLTKSLRLRTRSKREKSSLMMNKKTCSKTKKEFWSKWVNLREFLPCTKKPSQITQHLLLAERRKSYKRKRKRSKRLPPLRLNKQKLTINKSMKMRLVSLLML